MAAEISITDVKKELSGLSRKLSRRRKALAITRRGKRVLAIMPWDEYESLVETLDILSDKRHYVQIRRGMQEIQSGKGIPWEKAKQRLGE